MSGEPCTVDHFPGDLCPHEPTRKVPYPSATPGAVRAVLVHWALPLLARARRIADDIAERGCQAADPSVCAQLGEDIAALIGHGVTDQPPADELAEITRDEPPIRRRVPGAARLGTREHFLAARSGEPATRAVPEETGPPEPCTWCRCRRCHQVIQRAAGGWRHTGARHFDHAAVPFEHTPGALYHGAPVACDGCGAHPADGVQCLAPDGQHTWRPLPGGSLTSVHPAMTDSDACDGSMVHYFGPPDRPVARMFDSAGHPRNCPAYTPPADAKAVHAAASAIRTPLPAGGVHPCGVDPGAAHLQGPCSCKPAEPGALDPDRAPRIRLGDRTTSVVFGRVLTEPVLLVPAACWPDEPEWVEPAAPVEEDPAARARRLDRARDDAGRAYRAATYEADQAWREIGGRT